MFIYCDKFLIIRNIIKQLYFSDYLLRVFKLHRLYVVLIYSFKI